MVDLRANSIFRATPGKAAPTNWDKLFDAIKKEPKADLHEVLKVSSSKIFEYFQTAI